MRKKDFYEILGVGREAPTDEIKKKYRELAKQHHPDANQGSKKSEEFFKSITAAYETLKDKKKRQAYDRQGDNNHSQHGKGYERTGKNHAESQGYRRSGFYGQAKDGLSHNPDTPARGFDLQFMIDVPLVTVALGGKVQYVYEKYINCSTCGGRGKVTGKKCGTCNGKRQALAPTALEVEIPAGVADQFTLRIENQGCEGRNGAPPGDLLLKINTLPHPRFKRVRNDIFAKIAIPKKLALEGGVQEVETLDSIRAIPVEEGTLTGEELRLQGEGAVSPIERKRGDFIIKFFVSEN